MAVNFTTPKGRMVGGDAYKMTQNTDSKTGQPKLRQDGSPMMSSYIALAIPKNDPAWSAFKAMCDAEALKAWPNGQTQHPQFASKIEDGDSTIPNKKGKRNADREGFPGHWIVKFGSGYAPKVVYWDNNRGWVESTGGHVKLGDFISVAGTIDSNKSAESPGMYMNLNQVAFEREGPAITVGIDPNDAFGSRGPGNGAPAGTSQTAGAATTQSSGTAGGGSYSGYMDTDAPPPPGDDAPPPPSGPQMTEKAQGKSYESFTAKGWTDAQLRQHGYIA
jgi:hypothetical protein